jgi:tetratricopeptide (TPR) repeat protein
MKEHNANLCLTLVEKEFCENDVWIRQMVVNEQKPNGIYETYFFYFYHFTIVRAKDHFERVRACIKPFFYNAAIRHFSCAIKLDPSMGLAFMYRGFSYLRIQEYDKAIEDLTQAINSNMEKVEMPSAFSFRGLAYKEAGDFDKARADFAKALELDPDDEWAKEGLGEINKT